MGSGSSPGGAGLGLLFRGVVWFGLYCLLLLLPLGVALFESSYGTNYPQLMAVALLAMLPVLIVFLVLQRNFIEAMTMQSIKG